MADKKPAAAPPAADAPKTPLLPIIGAALGSAALVAGAMFFMMPKGVPADGDAAAEQADAADEAEADDPQAQTRYVAIEEPLVVNLSGGEARFLQVKVQLATRSETGQAAIETHLPALQNALLVMLRQTTPEELAEPEVMSTLQKRALGELNRLLEAETREKGIVRAVVFTSFVKQ